MTNDNPNQLRDYQAIEESVHSRFLVLTDGIFHAFCKKHRDYYPHRLKIRWSGKLVQSLIYQELDRLHEKIALSVTSSSASSYREVIINSILYARLAQIGRAYIYKYHFKKYQNE